MPKPDYAFRKPVRNNAVVREVDRGGTRQVWRLVLVGALLAVLALFSASQHFELLEHGYRLDPLQRDRAQEEETRRQLRLEIETLRRPQRIERLAIERLNLVAPDASETVVIERAVAPERPASTLVASR